MAAAPASATRRPGDHGSAEPVAGTLVVTPCTPVPETTTVTCCRPGSVTTHDTGAGVGVAVVVLVDTETDVVDDVVVDEVVVVVSAQ